MKMELEGGEEKAGGRGRTRAGGCVLDSLAQGGRDVRDVGLTDKVDKLRSDLSALDDELHDRSGREEEKREQLEKFILELQSSALQLKDEVLQEKSRTSSDILSLREDLEQKNAHQAQELEDLRLHVSSSTPFSPPLLVLLTIFCWLSFLLLLFLSILFSHTPSYFSLSLSSFLTPRHPLTASFRCSTS